MEFKKEWLQDLVYGDFDTNEVKVVENEMYNTSRWSVHYSLVFQILSGEHKDKFFSTSYCKGATEMQDEQPFEYDGDMIECIEVKPVEKTIIVYEVRE